MEHTLTIARQYSISTRVAAFCFLWATVTAIFFPDSFALAVGAYPVTRFIIFFPPILIIGLMIAGLVTPPHNPWAFLRRKFAERGKAAFFTILTVVLSVASFTTLKHEYSQRIPFFADAFLARADQIIHFGDPWRWLRPICPSFLDYPLFILYSGFWFFYILGGIILVAFMNNAVMRDRFFLSFASAAFFLGSPIRLLASSAGPIFYDRVHGGERFADLQAALLSSPSGTDLLQVTDYLHDSYIRDTVTLGTGIAAMPSMHVALSFLYALAFNACGGTIRTLAWGYFAMILFGSVYFGWHYALDGYISIILVYAIWRIVCLTIPEKHGPVS